MVLKQKDFFFFSSYANLKTDCLFRVPFLNVMPDIRLGQLDMDPREKKGPLLLKYNSVTALPIAEYLLPVSFDKEGILGSLFVSYRTLRVNWVDDLTFFRIIMWASTGA